MSAVAPAPDNDQNSPEPPTVTTGLLLSIVAWLAVTLFWLFATRDFHPTWTLATIVTFTLLSAYACVAYMNHYVFIPHYLRQKQRDEYVLLLFGSMAGLTLVALAVIRLCYTKVFGPYPVNHFAIDLGLDFLGMVVHVGGAAGIAKIYGQITKN